MQRSCLSSLPVLYSLQGIILHAVWLWDPVSNGSSGDEGTDGSDHDRGSG